MTEQDLDILAAKIAAKLSVIPRWMTLEQGHQVQQYWQSTFSISCKKGQIRGLEIIQKILGHSDIKTTQICAKVLNKEMISQMQKLSNG